jgi:hypothetical protein
MRHESDLKARTSGLHSGRRVLAEDSASPSGGSDAAKSVVRNKQLKHLRKERGREILVSEKREDKDPQCPKRERTRILGDQKECGRKFAVSGKKEDRKERGRESSLPEKPPAEYSLLMGCRYLHAAS